MLARSLIGLCRPAGYPSGVARGSGRRVAFFQSAGKAKGRSVGAEVPGDPPKPRTVDKKEAELAARQKALRARQKAKGEPKPVAQTAPKAHKARAAAILQTPTGKRTKKRIKSELGDPITSIIDQQRDARPSPVRHGGRS
jgi:hypothetical protein